MMTDEQILSLASKYLELHPIHGDVSVWKEWSSWKTAEWIKAEEIEK